MTPRRLLLLLLAALALLVTLAGPASAHAVLRSTTPTDGDALDAGPAEVSLEFNEPVSTTPGGVRVFNSEAVRVDRGDASAQGPNVSVALEPDLAEGTYVVSYRVISADSHPVQGAFVFTIGEATADEAAIDQILAGTSETGMQTAAAAVRFLQYAAALLAAGGALFLIWIHDRATDERPVLTAVVVRAAVATLVVTLIGVGVQAALVTGLGMRAMIDPSALAGVATSTYGISTAALVIGTVLLIVGGRRLWDDWAVVTAAAGAIMTMGAFALTGHTASTDPRWLVVTADIVHTVAAAAWFGGLVLLAMAMRRRRLEDDPVGGATLVSRFSSMATYSIVALAAAGTALGWAEVRAPRALWTTGYGITLLVKLGLVAIILVVAAYNRRRLVPAIRNAGADAWSRLRSTLRLEVVGLLAVIAVTAVLVNLVPAREAAGITGPLTVREQVGADYLVDLTVDPNRAGLNEMHIYLFDASGRPADAEEMIVGLSMPAEEIGPIEREPSRVGPGHWTLTGAEIPIAGRWIVTLDAAVTRFDQVSVDIPIDVGG